MSTHEAKVKIVLDALAKGSAEGRMNSFLANPSEETMRPILANAESALRAIITNQSETDTKTAAKAAKEDKKSSKAAKDAKPAKEDKKSAKKAEPAAEEVAFDKGARVKVKIDGAFFEGEVTRTLKGDKRNVTFDDGDKGTFDLADLKAGKAKKAEKPAKGEKAEKPAKEDKKSSKAETPSFSKDDAVKAKNDEGKWKKATYSSKKKDGHSVKFEDGTKAVVTEVKAA